MPTHKLHRTSGYPPLMSSGLNILYTSVEHPGHARIQKFFVRGGPTLRKIFLLVDEGGGGEDPKIQLEAGHHWPASEMPFKWRFAGVPMIAQH